MVRGGATKHRREVERLVILAATHIGSENRCMSLGREEQMGEDRKAPKMDLTSCQGERFDQICTW
jgi:hypothetical protein